MEEKLKQQPTDLIKIVLYGPESTGKTTLARQLAEHYNTEWVPEYAREYLQKKWDREQRTCEPEDLLPIAIGQMHLENSLAKTAKELLVCDTDLLETKVYSEAYYTGHCDPVLEKYALENSYDLYLLTDIDTPWEADDLRDKPNERQKMFAYFKDTLERYDKKFITLKGDKKRRLETAITHIEKLRKRMDFTQKDIEQLESKGISKEKVLEQIETFKAGIPFVHLEKAAVVGEGILRFSEKEQQDLIAHFEQHCDSVSLLKFVPASGAASRMFKAMFNFIDSYDPTKESLDDYVKRTGDTAVEQFVSGMKNFPFYEKISERIAADFKTEGEHAHRFVTEMLNESGLNYGFFPKGLLPFHNYDGGAATPFKEHLKEAARYAKAQGSARLHFTISVQHDAMFKEEERKAVPEIAQSTSTEFQISYSNQKPSTDTLAVNMDDTPFRNPDGTILFRPGGHGALIENLNDQDADIVFIKNIDNVVVDENLNAVANSKKMLAGLLMKIQAQAFENAGKLDSASITANEVNEVQSFLENRLNAGFSADFEELDHNHKIQELKKWINRPIRICGMVKNEGEPGGGPFFIKDKNGGISLQIIESAQIDQDVAEQKAILKNATHFNPVDLVCSMRNYKGEKYDLLQFVDSKQGFITEKTKEGKALKALELPGLWNGAMAFWNTIFVEVPLVTFNPVKTVNDLLKETHQA